MELQVPIEKLSEVSEEYGIAVVFIDGDYTSSSCSVHGNGCGKMVSREL